MTSNLFGIVKKVNAFSKRFAEFWESSSSFKHFHKKMTLIAYVSPKLQSGNNMVRQIFKQSCFRAHFDSQHVKASETLTKSAWQHFHHIF